MKWTETVAILGVCATFVLIVVQITSCQTNETYLKYNPGGHNFMDGTTRDIVVPNK
jgi:hypothetical protein